MEPTLLLVVGAVWGVFTVWLLGRVAVQRVQLGQMRKAGEGLMDATKSAMTDKQKAEADLAEARGFFKQELERPAAALFTEEQVRWLAKELVKLMFPDTATKPS